MGSDLHMPSSNNLNENYSVGNPLKMIKEYKSKASVAMSFGSNASTKDAEEMMRFNKIMNEPIERLLNNMDSLSRPVSSYNKIGKNNLLLKSTKAIPKYGQKLGNLMHKKERAMTAHNKLAGRDRITRSAYHFNTAGQQNCAQTIGPSGAQITAGQNLRFAHQNNSSIGNFGHSGGLNSLGSTAQMNLNA